MSLALFCAMGLAGFAYVVSPGPAFLAVFALAAAQGRAAAIRFLAGHLAGDVSWSALALAALVGANRLGPRLFALLGLLCGCYLIVLGWRAMFPGVEHAPEPVGARRPFATGILFGLTNPKAYPVATAMFAAIALPYAGRLSWADVPLLLGAAIAGFLPGYAIIVYAAGLRPVRQFFATRGHIIGRVIGLIFAAFGVRTMSEAGSTFSIRP